MSVEAPEASYASDFHDLLVECARAEGFPLAGAVDIDLALQDSFAPHLARYDDWLARGYSGAMSYLARGRERRADPRLVFPEARSVFCVVAPYPRSAAGAPAAEKGPRYARYLRSQDYHQEIAARLDRALTRAAPKGGDHLLRWKTCVDTSAVLERSWAALAGLGWIGKNTLLIHPKLGSYLFIGAALLNRETGRGPRPLPGYCGNCRRCLDACPTGAFTKPGVLDATRCISYWTLEKRGPLEISDSDRRAMGTWVAGCDICQEVCPFNLKPAREEEAAHARQGSSAAHAAQGASDARSASPDGIAPPDDAIEASDWDTLLGETEDQYRERVRNSSLSRVKPAQFSRNLAIALSNAALTLPEVERGEFRARLAPKARARAHAETDPVARAEWERCVEAFDGE